MLLDMRSIIFSGLLINIVCLYVAILLWRQNRLRYTGMMYWVFTFLCQALSVILIMLRGYIPDWASMVLPTDLILIGTLLGYMGLLAFVGKKSSQIHNYVILVLVTFVHVYFTYVQSDLNARIYNFSTGLLILCFQCAWLMLYRVPANMRTLTRHVGMVFVFFCLASIFRMVGVFVNGQYRIDFFQPGSSDALAVIIYQILFILLTFALALMFNKRLLQEVTTQEEKYSRAFYSSANAINLTRLQDGVVIEANTGFLNMLGYQHTDVIGKPVMDLHLWERDEDRKLLVEELLNKRTVRDREFQFQIKSGEKITGLFSAEIIVINNEEYVLSSINDITARKKTEEALKKSNAYLEILNNALADAIFVVKFPERIIEYLNEAAVNIFGYAKEEVLEKNSLMFYPDQEGYLRSAGIFQETLLQKKNLARFETILKRKNGETFPAWFTASFLKEDERVTKLIVIVQNITEQKRYRDTILQLNAELEQRVAERTQELSNTQTALLNLVDDLNTSARDITSANRSLEAVNKELAAFSYSVSHDLRAPLRSIDGFSEALMEDYGDKLDDEAKNYLERIRRATENMNRLIDDLLSLSRVLKSDFYRQDFDLSAMVREIAGEIQQRNMLKDLVLDIQDGIVIKADQRLLGVAMTNLLDNAWKFTSKSEHPHIEFGADVQNGETVFFVRDNGAGFNMEYVGKIFDAFQRLHRMEEFPGTGIGLATVQRIIHRHGGRIWAEGEPGKGAAFYFTLEGKELLC